MKTALVFGHTSGLGYEVTKTLIKKNYKVIGFARSQGKNKSNLLTDVQVDLSDKEGVQKAISIIKKQYHQFNYLIFCTGVLTAHNLDDLSMTDTEIVYRVNVFAPMMIESALLELIKQNEADVVNVTSSSLVDYYPQFTEYSTSKSALQKFTNDLKKELQTTRCRVIEFCPSGFTSNIYKNMTGDKVNRDESLQMKAEDLASLMIYLLELPKKIEISHIYIDRK